MAAKNDQISLVNGQNININTYQYGQEVTFGFYQSRGTTQIPSVLDLSDSDISNIDPFSISIINYLTNPHSESEVESAEYIEKKETFNNNVVWIWGSSIDSGGCYIRKITATTVKIGGVTCLRSGMVNNVKYYSYYILESDTYPLSELYDVCFMYDESTITRETWPSINMFTLAEMRDFPGATPGQPQTYYGLYTSLVGGVYTYNDMYSMDQIAPYISWVGSPSSPSGYWQGVIEGVTYPHSLAQHILGADFSGQTIESGDIWGSMKGDNTSKNSNAGNSQEQGGNGEYPSETSHMETPDASGMAVNCVNSGFVSLFNPTLAQVKSFNDYLFTNIDDQISQQLKRLWTDPLDYILFIAMCHFNPPYTVDDNILFAGIDTGVQAHVINNQYKDINCGTVHIPGDCGNFLDFNNMTKVSVYLPYAGIKQLSADDVIGSTVTCKYHIDMLSGNCLITLKCHRDMRREADAQLDDEIYTFNGNCFQTFPITGSDWRGFYNSVINIITGVGQLAGGVGSGKVGGVAGGLGNIANGIMSEKVSVETSGNLSSCFGYMGVQTPYIILERPLTSNPKNYQEFKGFTLNMRYKLGNLKGYTEIESGTLKIDKIDGITQREAELLKQVTADGFII